MQEYFDVNQLINLFNKTNKSPSRGNGSMDLWGEHHQIVKQKVLVTEKSGIQCATKKSFTKSFITFTAVVEKLGNKISWQMINLNETGYVKHSN